MHGGMRNTLTATLILSVLGLGCATAPAERRHSGVTVPSALVERAEHGAAAPTQAQACRSLSLKLWERDPVEALRFLRKGAALRDGECCLQYLAFSESKEVSLSQRLYARLFVEGLLAQGAILTQSGRHVTGELHYQLASAWRHTEPRDLDRARQNLESLVRSGASSELAGSPGVAQMIRELGARADEAPGGGASWTRERPAKSERSVPSFPDWAVIDVTAWGGGNDKLWQAAGVLAFVVNAEGEPSLRGRALWIRNCSRTPVYYTSLAAGRTQHELLPGREERVPLQFAAADKDPSTTGVAVSVRYLLPF
jgi:hypothetical protein